MRIHSISIKGFKACQELVFEPGRVNVFIGSNGSGKSTVLEAVGILSAALADRVDNAALSRRGIRLSANELYQSSFQSIRRSPTIDFGIKWDEENNQGMEYRVSLNAPSDENTWRYHSEVLLKNKRKIDGRSGASASLDFKNDVGMLVLNHDKNAQYVQSLVDAIRDYGIFQPNTPTLRGIQTDQYQNEPVGLCGGRLAEAIEGLLVEDIDGNPMFGSLYMDDVLDLIDWSVGIKVTPPKKSSINASVPTSRRVIEFTDKYMRSDKKFTAYDASEGALYVLLMLYNIVRNLKKCKR